MDYYDYDAGVCEHVREVLEAKHHVVIERLDLDCGVFEFTVRTDNQSQPIPFRWTPLSFGDGCITCQMTIEEFEANYERLDSRDLVDALRAAFLTIYKDDVELLSIDKREDLRLGREVYEMLVRLKPGKVFNNELWLSLLWTDGDIMAFEVGDMDLRSMLEYINTEARNR